MSDLSNAVRAKVSEECLTTKCLKEGCNVRLPSERRYPNGQRPYIVIDMDQCESLVPKDEAHCDFLFIGECKSRDWVVPLELKRGQPTVSEIVPQLQAGASIADGIVPRDAEIKFRPIAAYGGELKRHQWNLFRNKANWIEFRKQREGVLLRRCGISLEEVLKPS